MCEGPARRCSYLGIQGALPAGLLSRDPQASRRAKELKAPSRGERGTRTAKTKVKEKPRERSRPQAAPRDKMAASRYPLVLTDHERAMLEDTWPLDLITANDRQPLEGPGDISGQWLVGSKDRSIAPAGECVAE